MESDKDIVNRIVQGDGSSFEKIVRDYQRLVCHVVSRMLSNPSDIEDICQEVFLKVFQNLHRFEFNSKLSTWIARIAFNTALNHLDKKKASLYADAFETQDDAREEPPLAEGVWTTPASTDDIVADWDTRERLMREIDRLPPAYRTALTLFHVEELSYDEIASVMNMSVGTLKSNIFRARKILKERLLAKYSEEELR